MRVGYIQNDPTFGDKEGNFDQVRALVGETSADLLVLPELFATGYTFTSEDEARQLAENPEGATASFLIELSRTTGAAVVAGFVEEGGGQIFNSSMLVHGGKVIDTYRKIHLFNREQLWFTPGDKAPKVYEVNGVKIGIMICFDWMFPEVTRTLALQGMQVLAHPSNLVMPYCQNAMVTRCLENRVYAITANRIGQEDRGTDSFHFTGGSQITGVDGSILSHAESSQASISVIDIDETAALDKKINEYNDVLGDRRTELYL